MIKFRTKNKAFALRKTGAAALITAATLTLALLFTGCPQKAKPKAEEKLCYIKTITTKDEVNT